MRRKNRKKFVRSKKQLGGIGITLILVLIAVGLLFLLRVGSRTNQTPGHPTVVSNQYCQPENEANPTRITTFDYTYDEQDDGSTKLRFLDNEPPLTYVRIKKNVPISEELMTGFNNNNSDSTNGDNYKGVNDHFEDRNPYVTVDPNDGKVYSLQYPNPEAGKSVDYPGPDGRNVYFVFGDFKMIFLVHTKPSPWPTATCNGPACNSNVTQDKEYIDIEGAGFYNSQPNVLYRYWITDIYVDETKRNSLPREVLECQDVVPTTAQFSPTPTPESLITQPPQDITPGSDTLQLQNILIGSLPPGTFSNKSWWTPACKPAIYLYPQIQTNVKVEVKTKGTFTYTDPEYPQNGWEATAKPNGELDVLGKKYPYLYYESKIHDSYVNKPERGYVVRYDELTSLYDRLLPQIGLFGNQIQEFKDYWQKALPLASYYFVGVMDQSDIDAIEPLKITPNPDTMIRVRLYFEGLNRFKIVEPPTITTPERFGFSVVEWGGMVKVNPGDTFTCSQ